MITCCVWQKPFEHSDSNEIDLVAVDDLRKELTGVPAGSLHRELAMLAAAGGPWGTRPGIRPSVSGREERREITIMAKSCSMLRARMTPEARARAEEQTGILLREMPLQELRQARKMKPGLV